MNEIGILIVIDRFAWNLTTSYKNFVRVMAFKGICSKRIRNSFLRGKRMSRVARLFTSRKAQKSRIKCSGEMLAMLCRVYGSRHPQFCENVLRYSSNRGCSSLFFFCTTRCNGPLVPVLMLRPGIITEKLWVTSRHPRIKFIKVAWREACNFAI